MTYDDVVPSKDQKDDDRIALQEFIKGEETPSENLNAVDRIPPKCKMRNNHVCLFEELRDIFLFSKRNPSPKYYSVSWLASYRR